MNRLVLLGLALVLLVGLVVAGWNWQQQRVIQQAYEAGMAAADADRYEEALALALPYADRHDPQIDHLLGMIYLNGPDGIKDIDKGLTYRRAAADAGNMQAAFYLGKWLVEKKSTESSIADGVNYMQMAADCGMPNANSYLGSIYLDGTLLGQDLEKGRRYSLFAALAGINASQYNMSYSYALEIKRDGSDDREANTEFTIWVMVAAANGHATAIEILTELNAKLLDQNDPNIRKLFAEMKEEAARRLTLIQSPGIAICGYNPPIL